MEKKLLPALILTLFAGTAMAGDDASKTDKSMSGASSASTTDSNSSGHSSGSADRSMSGAEAGSVGSGSNQSGGSTASMSGDASIDTSRLAELSADPKMTLFLRLDTDKSGFLSNQEITAGKELLTLDVSGASSGDEKGIDLISFKTALTNSMLGMGGTDMASSSTGGSSGNTGSGSSASSGSGSNNASSSASTGGDRNVQGAGTEGTTGGMQSDKAMNEVMEEGGPTMLRGGPNPEPDALTPEQKLNRPGMGEGLGTQ